MNAIRMRTTTDQPAIVVTRNPAITIGVPAEIVSGAEDRLSAERRVDEILEESFPASDPPSWTPGVARPRPAASIRTEVSPPEAIAQPDGHRTFAQALTSLGGAAILALLVPFVILLVGLPIALAVRGIVEVLDWIF